MSLEPMVDMVGGFPLEHGERGPELDAEHPDACLCGFENYLLCPRFDEGLSSWTLLAFDPLIPFPLSAPKPEREGEG